MRFFEPTQTDRKPLADGGKNATVKAEGFGVSLRFTAVAAAYGSMRLPGFDAGREPRASRYLYSREPSQKFANFFQESP